MTDTNPDLKKKKKGGVAYVADFDLDNGELLDFFYMEDGDPPPIVKPKKTVPDPDSDDDLVREEEN